MTVGLNAVIRTSARMKNTVSGDVVNVFHWQTSGSGTPSDDDIMNAIEAKLSTMYAFLAPAIPSDQDPYDVRHDVVDWVGGKETVLYTLGTRSWTLTTPPSGTAEGLPQQDAAVINFRTAVPKTFGRKYVGALTESANLGGQITSAVQAYLVSYASALLTDIVVGGTFNLKAGVLTYKVVSGGHFVDFLAAVVQSIMCTQRRRRAQRGS